jgi:hypothetical protein
VGRSATGRGWPTYRSAGRVRRGCTASRRVLWRRAGSAAGASTAAGGQRRRTRACAMREWCATGRAVGDAGACVLWGRTVRRGRGSRRLAVRGGTAGQRGCGRRAGRATQGTTAGVLGAGARGRTGMWPGPGRVLLGGTALWGQWSLCCVPRGLSRGRWATGTCRTAWRVLLGTTVPSRA